MESEKFIKEKKGWSEKDYGNFDYEGIVSLLEEYKLELSKELQHHKATTVGLWATDKPELIPEDIKELFFEIN